MFNIYIFSILKFYYLILINKIITNKFPDLLILILKYIQFFQVILYYINQMLSILILYKTVFLIYLIMFIYVTLIDLQFIIML